MEQFTLLQTTFLVFYAIFWGAIFNVLPRRMPFHWPLALQGLWHGYFQAWWRAWLSVLMLNIVPLVYFGYVMFQLNDRKPPDHPLWLAIADIVVRGVVPAFAILGMYRIWVGIAEGRPRWFYPKSIEQIPKKYRHSEPVYRWKHDQKIRETHHPVVEAVQGAGVLNVLIGIGYVVVAGSAPCWPIERWAGW